MPLSFLVPLKLLDNHADGPQLAAVSIHPDLAERIHRLSRVVKRHRLDYASAFDYTPEYGNPRGRRKFVEDQEFRVDAVSLEVSDSEFFWTGYVKNSNIRFETDPIRIADLGASPRP